MIEDSNKKIAIITSILIVATVIMVMLSNTNSASPITFNKIDSIIYNVQLHNRVTEAQEKLNTINIRAKKIAEDNLAIAKATQARLEEEARLIAEAAKYEVEPIVTRSNEPLYRMTDNEIRELRKQIESGGNYNTYTGNGYVGAYQFAEQYMSSRMRAAGLGEYNKDSFLASPSIQDALADWYANSRYGGWQNVPRSGGW